ncbi:putative outer membrane protein [Helicobacter heilmannii]|uniref:Putative outer membrane protein n=3 Tax=Helicobacter heilmannii TaxID=35817 RepID=A0A0K2Y9J0_HELHE|nr:putative outer membrane protein [Helicobacter heilmannii]CCM12013.1 putative outer membrane protein [Helicobacter heilmannii ASB1.4]CRI34354.1 putative outer membrane protein [Helicobacter heilmannii]
MKQLGLIYFLCFLIAHAHPYSSYLDGAFFSFGMDAGGGNVLESSHTEPSSDIQKINAYHEELKDYQNAMNTLQANKTQTMQTLQTLLEDLQNLNLPSSASLIEQIQTAIRTQNIESVSSIADGVAAYQQYLNKTISTYESQNQALVTQAQQEIAQYKKELSESNSQNKQALENAINTFNSFNSQIASAAQALGISYTPLSLPAPLNSNSNISSLTPQQANAALQTLASEVNQIASIVGGDISKLGQASQKIAIDYLNNANTLKNAKTSAVTNALNQIVDITKIVGHAFHNQWVNFANGQTFFLNNSAHVPYINAGDTCVFDIILNNTASNIHSCGYQGGTTQDLESFQEAAKKAGVSMSEIWGTLFNLDKLKDVWISPSDCAKGGCSGVSAQEAQQGMQNFFNLMNGYVGAANFVGNFTNTKLYSSIDNDLLTGDFSAATNFVDAYVKTFVPDMLQTFVDNPIWLMSLVPGASGYNGPPATPSASQKNEVVSKWNSPNVKYCYDSPAIGLDFSQGYAVCGYNWWAQAMFMGYFGYLSNQTGALESTLSAQLPTVTSAITAASNATNAYNDFKAKNPQPSNPAYKVPTLPNPPIPKPVPAPPIPKISTNATPLPAVNKPQPPLLTFTTKNLQKNSMQLGLQAQGGYQKYFNSFIGMSYYGYFGFRYLYMGVDSNSLTDLNRYSLGIGGNLLFNLYSKIKKPKVGRAKIQAYGLFAGLLGIVNFWNANFIGDSLIRHNANLDATFGFSIRVDKFKWSLGTHIPIIDDVRTMRSGGNSLKLMDNYKSADLFMNFTTFF